VNKVPCSVIERHKATWTNSTPTTAVCESHANCRLTDQVGAILSEQHLIPRLRKPALNPPSRADPTGGWRTYSDPRASALKLYPLLSIAWKSPGRWPTSQRNHQQILCALSQRWQSRNNEELRAQCCPSARDESRQLSQLADGAELLVCYCFLKPYCQRLESTLDWFHIGKKFQTVKQALGDSFEDWSCKWNLWYGNVEESLTKLEMLMLNISDDEKCSKLKGLYNLSETKSELYQLWGTQAIRKDLYESSGWVSYRIKRPPVKKSGKMQWTREGATTFFKPLRNHSKTWTEQ